MALQHLEKAGIPVLGWKTREIKFLQDIYATLLDDVVKTHA
jgi:hypothetical protein